MVRIKTYYNGFCVERISAAIGAILTSRWQVGMLLTISLMVIAPRNATAHVGLPEQRAVEVLAESPEGTEATVGQSLSLPWLELLFRGGWLMIPIGLMSIVVVALAIERAIAISRERFMFGALAGQLHQLAECEQFDGNKVGEHCRKKPSALGRVVQAMQLRRDRPSNDIEQAITDACQHEADAMYGPVRTINLATSVTPLLGLLGTVLGMIQAFFATANLSIGANRSQALAEGIYVALVTTFAGLSVAIPAAVLAHYFESRIFRLLRDVEQVATELLPHIEASRDDANPVMMRVAVVDRPTRSRAS